MPERIGQYILPDSLIKLMKEKINESQKNKRETGFWIKKEDNILMDAIHCTGTECGIIISESVQKIRKELVGGFHVHPQKSVPYLSAGDLVNACNLGFECVGIKIKDDIRINCFPRISNREDCIKDAMKIYEEDKSLRSMHRSLEKMEPKTEEEFKRYNRLTDKYNNKRRIHILKLRDSVNKYFERISIK